MILVLELLGIVLLADLGRLGAVMPIVRAVPGQDRTCHALLAGMLSFFICAGVRGARLDVPWRPVLRAVGLVAVVFTFEEFTQRFLQHRGFDLWDLAADYAGIVGLGLVGVAVGRGRAPRQRRAGAS